ncbi:hypothetical protein Ssi02_02880 [Sinosporangium siamense]|uniref:Uncharacterized protein n=2 Tax=Sinosporangium siamense TaxID=1367973 RepID=A0A919RAQ3_9ACTN|nr:hypothetical protein Ssi02_02880 [Sinosporangium siamense]
MLLLALFALVYVDRLAAHRPWLTLPSAALLASLVGFILLALCLVWNRDRRVRGRAPALSGPVTVAGSFVLVGPLLGLATLDTGYATLALVPVVGVLALFAGIEFAVRRPSARLLRRVCLGLAAVALAVDLGPYEGAGAVAVLFTALLGLVAARPHVPVPALDAVTRVCWPAVPACCLLLYTRDPGVGVMFTAGACAVLTARACARGRLRALGETCAALVLIAATAWWLWPLPAAGTAWAPGMFARGPGRAAGLGTSLAQIGGELGAVGLAAVLTMLLVLFAWAFVRLRPALSPPVTVFAAGGLAGLVAGTLYSAALPGLPSALAPLLPARDPAVAVAGMALVGLVIGGADRPTGRGRVLSTPFPAMVTATLLVVSVVLPSGFATGKGTLRYAGGQVAGGGEAWHKALSETVRPYLDCGGGDAECRPGEVTLSLDITLQEAAEKALGLFKGAVVIADGESFTPLGRGRPLGVAAHPEFPVGALVPDLCRWLVTGDRKGRVCAVSAAPAVRSGLFEAALSGGDCRCEVLWFNKFGDRMLIGFLEKPDLGPWKKELCDSRAFDVAFCTSSDGE